MITIRISLTWFDDPPPHLNLPTGVHHISEIMPHVLDSYGLSFEDEPDSERPTVASEAIDVFAVMISCLESALAD